MRNVIIMRERRRDARGNWCDYRYSLDSGTAFRGSVRVRDLGAEDLHSAQRAAESILACELQEKNPEYEYLGKKLSHLSREYEVDTGLFRQVFHFFVK